MIIIFYFIFIYFYYFYFYCSAFVHSNIFKRAWKNIARAPIFIFSFVGRFLVPVGHFFRPTGVGRSNFFRIIRPLISGVSVLRNFIFGRFWFAILLWLQSQHVKKKSQGNWLEGNKKCLFQRENLKIPVETVHTVPGFVQFFEKIRRLCPFSIHSRAPMAREYAR